MKKGFSLLLTLLLLFTSAFARAEAFDPSQYSYEELMAILEAANESIEAADRQNAIENGNREIVFEEGEVLIFKGKTLKLAPEVRRVTEDAPEKTKLAYASSDASIAKVSAGGIITAVNGGDCMITCTASDDELISAEVKVHVAMPVTSVELSEKTAELMLTQTNESAAQLALKATVLPENAHVPTVTFASSDESIATVDEKGNVQAIAPGSVTISATSNEEVEKGKKAKSASCKITVLRAVDEIKLSETDLLLYEGTKETLAAEALPEDASKKTIEWESSDPDVVSITAKGQLTAKARGKAAITAKAADGSGVTAVCNVEVIEHVTDVSINKEEITLLLTSSLLLSEEDEANATAALTASIEPETAYVQTVTWSSSDENIAVVDANGNVQAIAPGSATITATSDDEVAKGKKAKSVSCKVTVLQAVESIAQEKTKYTIKTDESVTLAATVLPENASVKTVSWSSSNPLIAAVDEKGKVTAKAGGDCQIICKANDGSGVSAVYDVTVVPVNEVPPGTYVVGIDIPAGAYTVEIRKSSTNLWVYEEEGGKQLVGAALFSDPEWGSAQIKRLVLEEGNIVQIRSQTLYFSPYAGLEWN